MAAEIRSYTALIPAGTPSSAPVRIDVSFPPRIVQGVEIIVPPGPSGLVGFALQNAGVTVVPYASDAFIVTADEKIAWTLERAITSGSWQILGYNLDVFAHSIYVRFLLGLVELADSAPVSPIAALAGMSSATADNTAELAAALDAGATP